MPDPPPLSGGSLLVLRDLRDADGMRIGDLPPELIGPPGSDFATHPDWTPDGGAIVFTRASVDQPMETSEWTESGDIAWLPFDGDTPGGARVLVARTADESHFYPHVSPDGRWVVFNTGRSPGFATYPAPSGNLSSYAQVTARLRLVAIDGGTPIELARATHGTDVTASRARFAPFMQRSGTVMFLSFSSKLDYGWVLEQAALTPNELGGPGRGQLWMAAIDLARPGDPSFAPFWLPMQNVEDGNYDAFWLPPGSSCPP